MDGCIVNNHETDGVVITLVISSNFSYPKSRSGDTRLPINPVKEYKDFEEKGGWDIFLNIQKKTYIDSFEEASALVVPYKLSSYRFYDKKRAEISTCLPSHPEQFYPDFYDKGGWGVFLGVNDSNK